MKLGVIGAGNMGGALIRGFSVKMAEEDEIFTYDPDPVKMAECSKITGVQSAESLESLVSVSEIIIIAIKPNLFEDVLPEIAAVSCDKVYVSIAAGVSISFMQNILGSSGKIVRAMPNTPAMVNEGMTAVCRSSSVADSEFIQVKRIFESAGKVREVDEEQMHIITGISGSSPAYAYLYIEGLVQAGVEGGLPKETATVLAAQSTLGAAKMVLEKLGRTEPRQLCENVCSPGGTTIEAVKVLEKAGFVETVGRAARASAAKSKLMTR